MSVRKYFYLITEHENEELVGSASIMDSRMTKPNKNEEGDITVLDEEKRGFRDIGRKVGMGYHDFESGEEAKNNERMAEVLQSKLADIDDRWIEKAGLDPDEY